MAKPTTFTNLRLPDEDRKRLERIAKAQNLDMTKTVRWALVILDEALRITPANARAHIPEDWR